MIDDPVILLYDIETTNLGADMGVITTFAWRDLLRDRKTKCISIHETKQFKKAPWDDSGIVKQIYDLFLKADGVVAHYGDKFDMPFIKARLARHKIYLPSIPSIDTCLVARKHLRLQSNRLDNLADYFGVTPKIKVSKETWKRAQAFDVKALRELKRRCAGDVDTLADIYEHIKGYCNPVNRNLFHYDKDNAQRCQGCGSLHLISYGYRSAGQTKYRRLQCTDCGMWNRGTAVSSTKYRRLAL